MVVVLVVVVLFLYVISNLCKEVVFVFGELCDWVMLFVLYYVFDDCDFEVCKVVWIVIG